MQRVASSKVRGKAQAIGIAATLCLSAGLAHADHAPVWVIPNARGIPLVVDGVEVSEAVIEGDWGLYRPGHGTVTIYPESHLQAPPPVHFFPRTGRRPRAGRYEVETPQDRAPRPAEPYFRRWTAGSADAFDTDPTIETPTVIEAIPQVRIPRRPRPPRPRR